MTEDVDAELMRIVLERDALRKEARLPRLDIDAEFEKAKKNHAREVWKNTFYPHAIIITERSRPTQINSAGWFGINRLLRLSFDLEKDEGTFLQQALDGLAARIIELDRADWRGQIPWFGAAVYLAINYSETRAILYDLNGKVVETFKAPIETGYGAETIHWAKNRPGEQE